MTQRVSAPWHERHKSFLALLTALSAAAGVLGFLFRGELRAPLAAVLAPLGAVWRWLGTSHAVPGWLLLLLLVGSALAILGLILDLLDPGGKSSPSPVDVVLEGVRWVGHLSRKGEVWGDLAPLCPHCLCRIRPEYGHDPLERSWFTRYQCEDCGGLNQTVEGKPADVHDRIIRRVEAQWRRGQLRTSNPKA